MGLSPVAPEALDVINRNYLLSQCQLSGIKLMGKEKTLEVSHLMRREIQTPVVSALIEGFAKEFGTDKTKALAREIICKDAFISGKTLAQKYSGNSLNDLWKIVKEIWAKDGTMEIENLILSKKCLKFDVTHCSYEEMYESLGCKKTW